MINRITGSYIWEKPNWYDFTWDDGALISRLGKARRNQGALLSKIHSLAMEMKLESQAAILVEDTIETAAIEGQAYDRDSVRSSVARHLGLPDAGLPPANRHIDGLVQILLDATQNHSRPLTAQRLKSWQAALFPTGQNGLVSIKTGQWRGDAPMQVVSGPIGRETIHYQAPPADLIEPLMQDFLKWWARSHEQTEGLLRAAIAHFYFITIHPFEDGNGRIARAVTDMALAQDENRPIRYYSLSAQISRDRKDYYQILEQCQKGDTDVTPWLLWFLDSFQRAIHTSQNIIANVLFKADFWQQHSQTQLNHRQLKVVKRLLAHGPGGFEGGLTTKKYASMAKTSRATAYREISDLLSKSVLVRNPGKGRNVNYDLKFPGPSL